MRLTIRLNCLVIGWNCPRDGIVFTTNQHEASAVRSHITEDLCVGKIQFEEKIWKYIVCNKIFGLSYISYIVVNTLSQV